MQQEYLSFNHSDEDAVRRYEKMLTDARVAYFDVEEFELITEHYLENLLTSKASQVIEEAVKQHPNTASLQYLHAKVLYKKGRFSKAKRLLDKIAVLMQSDPEYWILKGEIHLKMQQLHEAYYAFKKSTELDEQEKDRTCLDIAYLLLGEEHYDLAIGFMEDGHKANPNNTDILFELASTYLEIDNYKAALKYLNKQLDIDAYLEEAWFTLGLIYWDKYRDIDKAMEAFDYVTVIDEKHEMAYFFKGQICFKQGDYLKAIEHYKVFGKLAVQESQAQLLIAECYEELNNTDRAIEYYNRALDDKNSRFDAWLGLGYCYIERKEYLKAILNFRRVLNERKEYEEAWSGLGDCYFALGKEEKAIETYQKSVDLNPKQPELWSVYADIFLSKQEYVKAIELLLSGLKNSPKNKELQFQLAIAYYKNGQMPDAINLLETLKEKGYKKLSTFLDHCPLASNDRGVLRAVS